ncbi:MAG: hypothetical protein K6E78_06345 [Treponema sp.]|nr:hypothetical protein [Treponema sp.]
MRKKNFTGTKALKPYWRKLLAFTCILTVFLSPISAKKKKKAEKNTVTQNQEISEINTSEAVKIPLPEKKSLSYFSGIEPEILSDVEKGSPESLLNAILHLRRKGESMTENEKVLHFIAVSIMQMCWKSQKFSETTFANKIKNNYTGAITSAWNGFYDPSSDPKDFLGYMLPALVLSVSETRHDYYNECLTSLQTALNMKPSSVSANYLMGLLYQRLMDFQKANEYFGKATSLSPDSFECSLAYARSFMSLSMPKNAFELSEKLLKTYPQNCEILKLCAQSAFDSGDNENAELYVNRVLQIEPENTYYLLFRARILVQKGEYIRASSLLDAYARKESEGRDYLLLRFIIQKNWNKNIAAAKTTIEKALLLYPEDSEIILKAASLASETGDEVCGKNGEELSDLILQKDAKNTEALEIKIASMILSQKWLKAYECSLELIKMEGLSRENLFNHIKICLSAGKQGEAWKYASKLYSEDSSDENIQQAYISVLVATGRGKEASTLINQLLPSANTKMKSSLYYQKSFLSGSETAILSDLRSSLTANPRNKDSLFRLYKIYFNKKEYRKAQYYLKQVVALSSKDEHLLSLNKELEEILKKQ